jgi:hypothetical protein
MVFVSTVNAFMILKRMEIPKCFITLLTFIGFSLQCESFHFYRGSGENGKFPHVPSSYVAFLHIQGTHMVCVYSDS